MTLKGYYSDGPHDVRWTRCSRCGRKTYNRDERRCENCGHVKRQDRPRVAQPVGERR